MTKFQRILLHEWFDSTIASIGLMWLSPWGSFDVTSVGFYVCIAVSILSVKTTRYFLKRYQNN
ncbi:hypothetical protein ADIS_4261 [Lunatimonas lonarensis]|uniref:Uncharacterized protein n=1 Tax=Lunatimonas lonarensis TaxID=1232681 RepID=R7ZLX6_9BACT|nr:hypothetical protein ADIS_4261 [Lunatimonas lonarensis]